MYIGIDVGGTFTDGVIIHEKKVFKAVKAATSPDTADSIIKVLKELTQSEDIKKIKRIVLSTTLITNILAQNQQDPVGLLLIPGPGVNPESLKFAGSYYLLQGSVDYRGRVVQELDLDQVKRGIDYLTGQGYQRIAVACKFSQRNPVLEDKIVKYIESRNPEISVLASHKVSGLLNWVRRANGAAFTLAVESHCRAFIEDVKLTLRTLGIECPVYFLKADGGTLPLGMSGNYPLETIFSGPAASALGALAFAKKDITSVVMDIGGTTTDLALILDGTPLLAERGAEIKNLTIPVRALAVSSEALGGDTSIICNDGKIGLGKRLGPALCLGGPTLTVTDVLVYSGYSNIGDHSLINQQLRELAAALATDIDALCAEVLKIFITTLEKKLEDMFRTWEEEPAYRIWQVMANKKERPTTLICLGGPAQGLGTLWGRSKGWKVIIPENSAVANAVGAALAKDTLKMDFMADTERMVYSTSLGGIQGVLNNKLKSLEEAKSMALNIFKEHADAGNAQEEEVFVTYQEAFNMVRGWNTIGKIYQIGLQSPTGILFPWEVSSDE